MEKAIVEMGRISSRGQIAIPAEIRRKLKMREGEKVMFMTKGNTIVLKRLEDLSFEELTKPIHEEAKAAGLKEEDIPRIVEEFRKQKRQK